MARVTGEDCIDKVDSPYELVLVAKERATQLNAGIEPTLENDNDKNTVISLREIADENIKVDDLTESAVYKLRKHVEQVDDGAEDDEDIGDDFESLYKGEISKKTNTELVNVFVPTTPNPTSGFLLMFPKSEIVYLDMTFEEASKFIVSAGTSDSKVK